MIDDYNVFSEGYIVSYSVIKAFFRVQDKSVGDLVTHSLSQVTFYFSDFRTTITKMRVMTTMTTMTTMTQ